ESKESENGGKDQREQQLKESVNKQVDSCTNVVMENIKEGESDSGHVSKLTKGVSQYVEIFYDKAGSPLGDEPDDETLNKKEDQYTETEKDKWTGEQKLLYGDIPEDIEPKEIRPMGNYTVSIAWPDGFNHVT
nr:Fe-S cluster assembly factor HCF101, chloroplastic [Tanacetum cinerariifolium]